MKRARKNVKDFVGTGLALGAGSLALGALSGTENASIGIANVSKFMPVAGSVVGAGMVLGAMNEIMPKKRKRII